jgi:hypothetical protein
MEHEIMCDACTAARAQYRLIFTGTDLDLILCLHHLNQHKDAIEGYGNIDVVPV